jgi:hypothetical protein
MARAFSPLLGCRALGRQGPPWPARTPHSPAHRCNPRAASEVVDVVQRRLAQCSRQPHVLARGRAGRVVHRIGCAIALAVTRDELAQARVALGAMKSCVPAPSAVGLSGGARRLARVAAMRRRSRLRASLAGATGGWSGAACCSQRSGGLSGYPVNSALSARRRDTEPAMPNPSRFLRRSDAFIVFELVNLVEASSRVTAT